MVNYKVQPDTPLSDAEKRALAQAKQKPVVYDEDSPEMTDAMEKAFILARKQKPFQGERLTLYVSADTAEKAKQLGDDYPVILGKLLDKAVLEYKIS